MNKFVNITIIEYDYYNIIKTSNSWFSYWKRVYFYEKYKNNCVDIITKSNKLPLDWPHQLIKVKISTKLLKQLVKISKNTKRPK